MFADFTTVANWMRFDRLDNLLLPAHVIAWRFTDEGADPWTKRVNGFKAQERVAIIGAARVLAAGLPGLLEQYGWSASSTAITAALSSSDTQSVPTKPLQQIGRVVAGKLGMAWMPEILTKTPHQKLHTIYDAAARDAEAAKAEYRCARISGVRRILVLDDLITRGTTQNNIATAIRASNREVAVWPIALGKSEKRSFAALLGRTLSNEHVPAAWATTWDQT